MRTPSEILVDVSNRQRELHDHLIELIGSQLEKEFTGQSSIQIVLDCTVKEYQSVGSTVENTMYDKDWVVKQVSSRVCGRNEDETVMVVSPRRFN